MRKTLIMVFVGLSLVACAKHVAPPEVGIPADPKAAWARVLERHVDAEGRIDFQAVAEGPADLERWVAFVAEISPRSHPQRFATEDDQLAYFIDAYNGLALYGVIRSGVLPEQKLRFFVLRKYTVGGERMSLYTLENEVIRPFGDARIHFALNCMSVSCPRLPREPWQAERLDRQLDAAAWEFFNSEQHLRVDHVEQVVHLSEILDFYTEDFLAEAPSLIAYVNRYRSEPIPKDYAIEFIS